MKNEKSNSIQLISPYSACFDEDGERLEEDVESGAESSYPERDENEHQQPDDGPQYVASAVSSGSVSFRHCLHTMS